MDLCRNGNTTWDLCVCVRLFKRTILLERKRKIATIAHSTHGTKIFRVLTYSIFRSLPTSNRPAVSFADISTVPGSVWTVSGLCLSCHAFSWSHKPPWRLHSPPTWRHFWASDLCLSFSLNLFLSSSLLSAAVVHVFIIHSSHPISRRNSSLFGCLHACVCVQEVRFPFYLRRYANVSQPSGKGKLWQKILSSAGRRVHSGPAFIYDNL